MDADLQKAHDKAKIGIMSRDNTFIITVLFSLKTYFNTSVPTAGTNGIDLIINPDFFMSITPEQRIGLMLHEAWHVCFRHPDRRKDLQPKRWNVAGDHVINLQLLSEGYELPPNGYHDTQFKGMSTKQVYDLLPEMEHVDIDCDLLPSNLPPEETKTKIENILIKAYTMSKMSSKGVGNIPQDILRKIEELINPRLPWETILQNFLNESAKEDYSMIRPNRRMLAQDIYLPGLNTSGLDHIALAVDTSGSVTDEQFAVFLSEINYIKETMQPKRLTVIDFDTTIKRIHEIDEFDSIDGIAFHGYGGTKINPVLDWANEHKPTALVVFTDGEFGVYEPEMKIPLIWIIYDNPGWKSNIGQVVEFDI